MPKLPNRRDRFSLVDQAPDFNRNLEWAVEPQAGGKHADALFQGRHNVLFGRVHAVDLPASVARRPLLLRGKRTVAVRSAQAVPGSGFLPRQSPRLAPVAVYSANDVVIMRKRWWQITTWLLAGIASVWPMWLALYQPDGWDQRPSVGFVFVIAWPPLFLLGVAWLITGFPRLRPARAPLVALVAVSATVWVGLGLVALTSDH